MSVARLDTRHARRLERCIRDGGVAVFPTDTVYGLCCDPNSQAAVRRLYQLKGYPPADRPARPAAVMFFALEPALEALPELEAAERRALETLLPGPVTLLLPNRARSFALACGPDPATLGLRVPQLTGALTALASVGLPAMQSSANLVGAPEARTLAEVPLALRAAADLVLDGGELLGAPSTVIDLRDYAARGQWRVAREGALPVAAIQPLLGEI